MERTIRLTLAYVGTGFCGWQENPGVRTVQGELARALRELTRESELQVKGASR
ncbi:MAG: tRNA pseudouridine(38-40) synthase TruA, partial [Deltaproteobacteria bacterium]|nr:tRNA pseudouridine(38-40) synthase TruA [Deltaproteobacteria bacterium]